MIKKASFQASLPPNYKLDYKLIELTEIFFNETTSRNVAEFIPDLIDYSPKVGRKNFIKNENLKVSKNERRFEKVGDG